MVQHTSSRPPADSSLDTVLEDPHRRVVLQLLSERDAPVTLDELAAALDGPHADAPRSDAAGTDDVGLDLHHNHLPRLADAGVVEYDPGEQTVRPVDVEDVTGAVDGLRG